MAEEIFVHKHIEENGDIIEMRIFRVPITEKNKEVERVRRSVL